MILYLRKILLILLDKILNIVKELKLIILKNKMESLYHYTSINKLGLILSSKKIRFTRLDHVNDPNEGRTSDFGTMNRYILVSCWTKHKEENLALWNMYTEKMRGVRIELPMPIFQNYSNEETNDSLVPEDQLYNKNKGYLIYDATNSPTDITYTDDHDKLNPNIRTNKGLDVKNLGIYKKKIWLIENETRFIIRIVPFNENETEDSFSRALENKTAPPIDHYDIDINVESLKKMKIRIGPKIHPGDLEIIKALIDKYNPYALVEESVLTGEIK
ncbi:hypothetical protein [uncultured Draconibacterium sp.]|uniref:hypothetical protein n=1 Tax=uncultured Draconibacterium sp. TaxID=1573823 RepID=UPI0037489DB8